MSGPLSGDSPDGIGVTGTTSSIVSGNAGVRGIAINPFPASKARSGDDSLDPGGSLPIDVAGVLGEIGPGEGGSGVLGRSETGNGVWGDSSGTASRSQGSNGVKGSAQRGTGVSGSSQSGTGVTGTSVTGVGVAAISEQGEGLYAGGPVNGVHAESAAGSGVWGNSGGTGNGVSGSANSGTGVSGSSQSGNGVSGTGLVGVKGAGINVEVDDGLHSVTQLGVGVSGSSQNGIGVEGTGSVGVAGIGIDTGIKGTGKTGVEGISTDTNGTAGHFQGNVIVTGDIQLANADCAEDFEIAGLEKVEPGTVMMIDSEGKLRQSEQAYDKRVAGVISGAGKYKPGLILGREETSEHRMPIALMGKVYCKVDAQFAAIEVGDLLTTSPTAGHAMKADDPTKAFGAVIGKALRPLDAGLGLIPILIALQ